MKALTQNTPANPKKSGRYRSVNDAVQQKQAALLTILAGADLTRYTGQADGETPTLAMGKVSPQATTSRTCRMKK